jgi:DNA repair ATPase RecN
MEINGNEEFQNQDDIVLDVDYKELSHQETIGTLSEKFDIGRTSMNSLVTGLEKGNVLSTSNKPKGSWRKLNDNDIEIIKKAVDLIKTEDLSISAAVDKMVAEYNNEKIPPKNTSELYKRLKSENSEQQMELMQQITRTNEQMKNVLIEYMNNIKAKLDEIDNLNRKLEESERARQEDRIAFDQKTDEITKKLQDIEQLQKELIETKEELEKEKSKGFFKKLFG